VGLFRALLVVFALAVALCAGLYFYNGERKYLRWAGWLFKSGIGAALVFFAVLLVERFS
jgi:choline-glycine betaine transporter